MQLTNFQIFYLQTFTSMNPQSAKHVLNKKTLNTNNDSIIVSDQEFFKIETIDQWNQLTGEDKAAIERGIEDISIGRTISLEDFIKKYQD